MANFARWESYPSVNLDNVFYIDSIFDLDEYKVRFGSSSDSYIDWTFNNEQSRNEALNYVLSGEVKQVKAKIKTVRKSRLSYEKVVNLWNVELADTAAVQKRMPTESLITSINRVTDKHFNTIDAWKDFIDAIKASPFLTGNAGIKPFKISLDWVVKPNNLAKVLEGYYHGE